MKKITARTRIIDLFTGPNVFKLDSGKTLSNVRIAYQAFGNLNSDRSNVIMVNHALTGNSHIAGIIEEDELNNTINEEYLAKYNKMYFKKEGWWAPLIGPSKALDTNKYFIICSNVLGSCYGTTGPESLNEDKKKYKNSFPRVSVRDMVRLQKALIDHLEINSIELAIGGSLGGMQVLEWAIMYKDKIKRIMPVAASVGHSPWAIGLNEASRNAIINDPEWKQGNYVQQPYKGFSLARKIAMLTYRSYESFYHKFGRKFDDSKNKFDVESYLDYQGEKIVKRFDANSYLILSEAMDNHDVGTNRGGIESALKNISCKTEIVGISSDILYPVSEQKKIVSFIKKASYSEIDSVHGHDAFLIEFSQLEKIIGNFLN